MGLYSVDAKVKFSGYPGVSFALCDQAQHLNLALRQVGGMRLVGRLLRFSNRFGGDLTRCLRRGDQAL